VNAVELHSVGKKYDDFVAVNNLSFAIPAGKVYGLLGPNGAGKTSTLRMMIGIIMPDTGSISILGDPFRRAHIEKIGYLPEERGLYRRMRVLDHLVLLAQLKGVSAQEARKRALSWCDRLELGGWTGKRIEELSKGMQQKVQFIGALLHQPTLIVLDEPFSGLDPSNANVLKDVLLELKRSGTTLLLSTHRMDQAERMCDSICLINHGRALIEGDLRQIKSGFGQRNVQIKYAGDSNFLGEPRLVESSNDYGNYVEVKLAPQADPQELLRLVAAHASIERFELMEPSLEEIFLDAVGKSNA
jgi:ABC-2 type transport system ATP-binding protein